MAHPQPEPAHSPFRKQAGWPRGLIFSDVLSNQATPLLPMCPHPMLSSTLPIKDKLSSYPGDTADFMGRVLSLLPESHLPLPTPHLPGNSNFNNPFRVKSFFTESKFVSLFDWGEGEVSREPFWKRHPEGSRKRLCLGRGQGAGWGERVLRTSWGGGLARVGGGEMQGRSRRTWKVRLCPALRAGCCVKCSHPSSLLFSSLVWDPDVDGPNAGQIMETAGCLLPAPTSADFPSNWPLSLPHLRRLPKNQLLPHIQTCPCLSFLLDSQSRGCPFFPQRTKVTERSCL